MANPKYTIRPEIYDCDMECYRKAFAGEDSGFAVYEDGHFCDWYETKEEARDSISHAIERVR